MEVISTRLCAVAHVSPADHTNVTRSAFRKVGENLLIADFGLVYRGRANRLP